MTCETQPKVRSLRNVIARQILECEDQDRWWRLADRMVLADDICKRIDEVDGFRLPWARGAWRRTSSGAGVPQ